jgi:hypothetical protein
MGGEEKLSKFKAATFKSKGKFAGGTQPIEFTADVSAQPPKQSKRVIKFDISGMLITRIEAVNGEKGWFRAMGRIQDMNPGMLAQQKNELYSNWIATVLPLKDPSFKLSVLKEEKVDDRPALAIKVIHAGHPDHELYFDKDSGLLVKNVSQQTETYYRDYKDIEGVKQYTKLQVKRGGKQVAEVEFSDFEFHEKLDDKVFEKPTDQ